MPWAAIDPGASRNACGVVAIDRDRRGMWAPIYLRELRPEPGRPLDLRNELVPIARELRALGCESWATDGWAPHDVLHAGIDGGIATVQTTSKLSEQWRHLLAICARGQHALGASKRVADEELEELASQLGMVREVFENGHRTIKIAEVGGLHGDLASAYARAFWHARAADFKAAPPAPRPRGRSEYGGEVSLIRYL
jgi:hypothetical protein